MATYTTNTRVKKITTGDESGTWGTSTNTNLDLLDAALGYVTHAMADSDETITIGDAAASDGRYLCIKFTGSLTATRTVTLAPNTLKKVWIVINATTGSQSIIIKQGSGSTVTVSNSAGAVVYADGVGAGGSIVNALSSLQGTWIGGTIGAAYGGTGLTSYTSGDIVYASGATTISKLNIGSANDVLTTDGSTPGWTSGLTNSHISASAEIAVSKLADGTAYQVIQTDSAGTGVEWTATLGAAGAGLTWNGVAITEVYGGTGQTSYTTGDVVYADGSNSLGKLGIGSGNTVLTSSGSAPQWSASLTLSGLTMSGTVQCADNILQRATLKDYAVTGVNKGGAMSGAVTIDLETGNYFWGTVSTAVTFTFSNPVASGDACGFVLELTNGGVGTTWPASVDWPAATAPTLQATGVDVLVFITRDGGTTWHGNLAMGDSS